MLRNYLVGKGALGISKAPIAFSSAPALKGAATSSVFSSGIGIGQTRLYDLAILQEFKASPDVVTGTL